jgi:hypothetical protein
MIRKMKGIYQRSVIHLDEPLPLPDGAQVDVAVVATERGQGELREMDEMRRVRRFEIKQAEFDDAYDELEQDFASQYRVVALTEAIIEEAASLAKKHGLRAYDAV